MAWSVEQDGGGSVRTVRVRDAGDPASFGQVINAWRTDRHFRGLYSEALREIPFDAFFWETPPVTANTVDDRYEFVVVDAPALAAVRPKPGAFAQPFRENSGSIVSFWNLGRDALLVAPKPAEKTNAAHLAAFLRSASDDAVDELWRVVGESVAHRLSTDPLWLNTSGLGVHWLHVRLDSRPKYYTHAPYRQPP